MENWKVKKKILSMQATDWRTWFVFCFRPRNRNISIRSTLHQQCHHRRIMNAKRIEEIEQIAIGYCITGHHQQIILQSGGGGGWFYNFKSTQPDLVFRLEIPTCHGCVSMSLPFRSPDPMVSFGSLTLCSAEFCPMPVGSRTFDSPAQLRWHLKIIFF